MADYAIHDTTLIGISNVIRKKEGSSALIDPAEYEDRVNLMGMLEEKTASSASICSFSDGASEVPLKNWLVTLPASLDGYTEVNGVRSGVNLFNEDWEVGGINDTTGLPNSDTNKIRSKSFSIIKGGTTCYVSVPQPIRVLFYASDESFISETANIRNNSFTVPSNCSLFKIRGTVDYGTTYNNDIMISYGSTATAYEAYSAPTTHTANLGRTIYGGTADLVTGEGQELVKKITVSSFTGTWGAVTNGYAYYISIADTTHSTSVVNPIMMQANQLFTYGSVGRNSAPTWQYGGNDGGTTVHTFILPSEYDTLTKANNFLASLQTPLEVTLTLATPTDFTFEGQEINTRLGYNAFWSDDGDTSVAYRASGTVTPVPIQPVLISKTITENGTYYAEDDDADGYSEVTVNVQGGATPFVPQFTETLIADNSAHASSFTLTEDYGNYDMVKIVWYESASSSGFLYTTPDILDEIFSVGVGKLCINKPSTNYYICYSKSGLTWTQTNQRNIFVHEIYGVTFTNCTMTATDLYKRGASTTTKYAVSSQTSLKDYDLFMMSSIHATDGSETMPTTWLYQYPKENMSEAFSCPVPTVLQEYNANDEAFVISEYGMTSARFFMVQGIKFTPTPSLLSMSSAPTPSEPDSEDPEEEVEEEET